jgi:hypothetical protein
MLKRFHIQQHPLPRVNHTGLTVHPTPPRAGERNLENIPTIDPSSRDFYLIGFGVVPASLIF